jgi:membrane-associated protease RseP (regulator of RpoE activity)
METIFIYDLSFLILFSLFIGIFLYRKRKNLKREWIMFLYRTKIGIKTIDYISRKFSRLLHVLKYFIVGIGLFLMAGMIYLLGHAVWLYIKFPQITKIIKAPPIFPVIPYFPRIFGIQSIFPPFYFTYFILAFAIVAIVHEFSHGIFMRLFKIRIKSTGFAFLGPILGAFVEEDKRNFEKKSNLQQMSVLGAGVFANLVFALIFFGILILFFNLFFVGGGYAFNNYAYSYIPAASVTGFGNFSEELTEVYTKNNTYFLNSELKSQLSENSSLLLVYEDTPAVRAGLKGAVVEIGGQKISNYEDLRDFLIDKKPGDSINIKTVYQGEEKETTLALEEHPLDSSKGYIGIGFYKAKSNSLTSKIIMKVASFKEPSTYYVPVARANLVVFIYNLLWWVAMINFFVALFNMVPLGILDGGRFFYLAILSVTKSKKFAEISFKLVSYAILLIFLLLMVFWFFRIF